MARTCTLKGNPQNLDGPALNVGDTAPSFTLQANDMSDVTLSGTTGRVRVLCAVPSLDTPTCDTEARRFNEDLSNERSGSVPQKRLKLYHLIKQILQERLQSVT